jgi:hypothetical protein
MDDKVLRLVFTFFVGALLALFIGFGIHTVYPPPEQAATGGIEQKANPSDEELARLEAARQAYESAYADYSRDVSLISMGGAVVMLVLSLMLERGSPVMANGLLLGGLVTLVYGVGRGFASRDSWTLFGAMTLATAIVLVLGFRRFRRERGHKDLAPGGSPGPVSAEGPG